MRALTATRPKLPDTVVLLEWLRRLRERLDEYKTILLPGLTLLVLVIAINWQLFVTPMVENGDFAANELQVQDAKHFHELLGNYSRWNFHHPGPFLFYLYAAGQKILYDWLHLVPAPLNAECLTEIAFSTTCLFLSVYVFYSHVRKPLFPALAVLCCVLFLYAIATSFPGSAMVSLWLPYAEVFTFLLFACSAASLAAGNWKHLPLLALSAMILIHGHAAQLLFAVVLAGAALSVIGIRELRNHSFYEVFAVHKRYILSCLAIVLLFLAPIAIDWIIDHPNNIHQIRAYLREHRGEHNSVSQAILYTLSFFTYQPLLGSQPATFRDLLNSAPFVKVYWSAFLLIALFALVIHLKLQSKVPLFVKFVFTESILITVLFVYWAWKMIGGMFSFEGYFYYSVQLFVLFGFVALISGFLATGMKRGYQIGLACALTAPVLMITGLKNTYWADPALVQITKTVGTLHGCRFALVVEQNTWPTATGLASYLVRSGKQFCVERGWGFVFGHECRNIDNWDRITLTSQQVACSTPCSVLYKDPNLFVTAEPPSGRMLYDLGTTIDFHAGGNAYLYVKRGWSEQGNGGSWTLGRSSILLVPLREIPKSDPLLEFWGRAFIVPRRPKFDETVRINGHDVDRWTVSDVKLARRLVVPRSLITSRELQIEFIDEDPTSPAQAGFSRDERKLGIGIEGIKISPVREASRSTDHG